MTIVAARRRRGTARVIEAHVVRLPDGERVRERVVAALIERDPDAAVVADDHPVGVDGIDPHAVMIDMETDRRVDYGLASVI
jgi:hypothetical protein